MSGEPDRDSWLQRLHRWRLRNAWAVQFVLLSLVALAMALSLFMYR